MQLSQNKNQMKFSVIQQQNNRNQLMYQIIGTVQAYFKSGAQSGEEINNEKKIKKNQQIKKDQKFIMKSGKGFYAGNDMVITSSSLLYLSQNGKLADKVVFIPNKKFESEEKQKTEEQKQQAIKILTFTNSQFFTFNPDQFNFKNYSVLWLKKNNILLKETIQIDWKYRLNQGFHNLIFAYISNSNIQQNGKEPVMKNVYLTKIKNGLYNCKLGIFVNQKLQNGTLLFSRQLINNIQKYKIIGMISNIDNDRTQAIIFSYLLQSQQITQQLTQKYGTSTLRIFRTPTLINKLKQSHTLKMKRAQNDKLIFQQSIQSITDEYSLSLLKKTVNIKLLEEQLKKKDKEIIHKNIQIEQLKKKIKQLPLIPANLLQSFKKIQSQNNQLDIQTRKVQQKRKFLNKKIILEIQNIKSIQTTKQKIKEQKKIPQNQASKQKKQIKQIKQIKREKQNKNIGINKIEQIKNSQEQSIKKISKQENTNQSILPKSKATLLFQNVNKIPPFRIQESSEAKQEKINQSTLQKRKKTSLFSNIDKNFLLKIQKLSKSTQQIFKKRFQQKKVPAVNIFNTESQNQFLTAIKSCPISQKAHTNNNQIKDIIKRENIFSKTNCQKANEAFFKQYEKSNNNLFSKNDNKITQQIKKQIKKLDQAKLVNLFSQKQENRKELVSFQKLRKQVIIWQTNNKKLKMQQTLSKQIQKNLSQIQQKSYIQSEKSQEKEESSEKNEDLVKQEQQQISSYQLIQSSSVKYQNAKDIKQVFNSIKLPQSRVYLDSLSEIDLDQIPSSKFLQEQINDDQNNQQIEKFLLQIFNDQKTLQTITNLHVDMVEIKNYQVLLYDMQDGNIPIDNIYYFIDIEIFSKNFNWNHINRLNLSSQTITTHGWRLVVENSRSFQNMQTLNLNNNNITTITVSDIQKFRSLETLILTQNPLDQGTRQILEMIKEQIKINIYY